MTYLFKDNSFGEIQDAILIELATSHPQLSFSTENNLKRVLLEIMVNDAGWQASPATMRAQFETAMDDLASEEALCAAE